MKVKEQNIVVPFDFFHYFIIIDCGCFYMFFCFACTCAMSLFVLLFYVRSVVKKVYHYYYT